MRHERKNGVLMPTACTHTEAALRLAAEIDANVDMFYDGIIDYEKFSMQQRLIWDRAKQLNVTDEVLDIVRPKL